MSFWKRLFGRKPAAKPPAAAEPEPFVPGHSRAAARPLYSHVPAGWPAPTVTETTNLLRVDAILTLAQYMGEDGICEDDMTALLVPKLTPDGGAIRMDVLFTHKATGKKHAAFFCYDDAACARFPYAAAQLVQEPGYGDTLYFGVKPYDEVMQQPVGAAPDALAFIDLFKRPDEDFTLPDGTYALWQQLPEDPLFAASEGAVMIGETYAALDGYQHHFASVCYNQWFEPDEPTMSPLPDEPVTFYLIGPELEDVVVTLSAERGMQLQTHSSASATYRLRLWKQMRDFARELVSMFREKGVKPGYEQGLSRPMDYWREVFGDAGKGQLATVVSGFVVGDRPSHHTESLRDYDSDVFADEQLVPRVLFVPDPTERAFAHQHAHHVVGDLYCAYGIDRGDHYTYVTKEMFKALPDDRRERLHGVAMDNLIAALGENVGVQRAGHLTFGRLNVDENLASATLLHYGLWEQIAESVGGDLVVAVPARSVVAFAKLTEPDALEALAGYCDAVTKDAEQRPQMHRYDDTFYKWTGLTTGWTVMA